MCLVQTIAAHNIVRRATAKPYDMAVSVNGADVEDSMLAIDTMQAETESTLPFHLEFRGEPDLHYFRVPKSGSSAYYESLQACANKSGLVYHRHGDGCASNLVGNISSKLRPYDPSDPHTRLCNASYVRTQSPNAKFIAVIRDPCERFMSSYWHIARQKLPSEKALYRSFGPTGLPPWKSEAELVDWINETTKHCPRSGDDVQETRCMVEAISNNFKVTHRVILWPQAMFLEKQTMPICYHSDHEVFKTRMQKAFSGSCDVSHFQAGVMGNIYEHPAELKPDLCERVKDLYRADTRWWSKSCA
jgi:hypothetical protein